MPGLNLKCKPFSLQDVKIFTVGRKSAPFLWNPFRPPPNVEPVIWINTISEVLEKSHVSGPGVAYFFSKIYSKLFKKFRKFKNFYPNFFDGLSMLQKMKVYERELKWKQTALRIFHTFTINGIAENFNARNPLKLEELLEKPVIIELDLEMPKPLRVFFTEVILRWIHLYRLGQGETETLRHVLFLEEVHNLFPKTRIEKESYSSLENIYRELRGFGQGLVSITQHPSLLPIYILGNCHTLIFLGLQHEKDIKAARQALFLDKDEEVYFSRLKVGEAIVRVKNRIEPCLVKIPLVEVRKGKVKDEDVEERMRSYLQKLKAENSKFNSFRPIYSEDNNRGKRSKYSDAEEKLLLDILKFPTSSITQRYKRLGLNPKYGNYYKNLLVEKEIIEPVRIITRKGFVVLFEITEKGKAVLREKGVKVMGNESVIHKFWKEKVAEYYRNLGFKVFVEKKVNGTPDIVVEATKKVAIEIETGNSDFLSNIFQNLKNGFDEIVIVATEKEVEERIRRKLAELKLEKRIKVTNVLAFDIT